LVSFTLLLQIPKALLLKPVHLDPALTGACTGCRAPPTSWHNPRVRRLTSSHEIHSVTFIRQDPSCTWEHQRSALSWVRGVIQRRRTTCVQTAGKPFPQILPHVLVHGWPNAVFSWEECRLPSVSTKDGEIGNKCINHYVSGKGWCFIHSCSCGWPDNVHVEVWFKQLWCEMSQRGLHTCCTISL